MCISLETGVGSNLPGARIPLPPPCFSPGHGGGISCCTLAARTARTCNKYSRLRDAQVPGKTDAETLEPGSYFGSEGEVAHHVSCEAGEECVIYVRTEDKFDIVPAQSKKQP